MKYSIFTSIFVLGFLMTSPAHSSGMDRSYCIGFERGFATNSCSADLDITWCVSDSYSSCTDAWKASYVPAQGRATVDFDRDDLGKIILKYACDKGDSACLDARNAYTASKGR